MNVLFPLLLALPAVVIAAANDEHVFWIPNPCDRFYGLPAELQEGFKAKNPQVIDLNLIYSYATYRLISTPAPPLGTWTWTTTGPSTLLTSHYDPATVTCAEAKVGVSAKTAAVTEKHTTEGGNIGTTSRATTTQKAQPTGGDPPHGQATITTSPKTTAPPPSVASGTTHVVDSAAATTSETRTVAATGVIDWRYCFHDLEFVVDPKKSVTAIEDFCELVGEPDNHQVQRPVDGEWWKETRTPGDSYGYYFGIKSIKSSRSLTLTGSKVPNIADFVRTCNDTLNKAWSCK